MEPRSWDTTEDGKDIGLINWVTEHFHFRNHTKTKFTIKVGSQTQYDHFGKENTPSGKFEGVVVKPDDDRGISVHYWLKETTKLHLKFEFENDLHEEFVMSLVGNRGGLTKGTIRTIDVFDWIENYRDIEITQKDKGDNLGGGFVIGEYVYIDVRESFLSEYIQEIMNLQKDAERESKKETIEAFDKALSLIDDAIRMATDEKQKADLINLKCEILMKKADALQQKGEYPAAKNVLNEILNYTKQSDNYVYVHKKLSKVDALQAEKDADAKLKAYEAKEALRLIEEHKRQIDKENFNKSTSKNYNKCGEDDWNKALLMEKGSEKKKDASEDIKNLLLKAQKNFELAISFYSTDTIQKNLDLVNKKLQGNETFNTLTKKLDLILNKNAISSAKACDYKKMGEVKESLQTIRTELEKLKIYFKDLVKIQEDAFKNSEQQVEVHIKVIDALVTTLTVILNVGGEKSVNATHKKKHSELCNDVCKNLISVI